MTNLSIGIVLFPNLTQLDFTAPYEVFAKFPNTQLYLLAETLDPIRSDGFANAKGERGLAFLPDTTFDQSPDLDVLFVPGGIGVNVKLEDSKFLDFLKTQGEKARYVTSVCTGSLLLAAAGLLAGYRATTHWLYLDLLELLGVEVVKQRVVIDRDRITGAGVTSGIDFALVIASELFTEAIAQSIQLQIEYNPQPPFESGSPQTAPEAVLNSVKAASKNNLENRLQIIQKIIQERRK